MDLKCLPYVFLFFLYNYFTLYSWFTFTSHQICKKIFRLHSLLCQMYFKVLILDYFYCFLYKERKNLSCTSKLCHFQLCCCTLRYITFTSLYSCSKIKLFTCPFSFIIVSYLTSLSCFVGPKTRQFFHVFKTKFLCWFFISKHLPWMCLLYDFSILFSSFQAARMQDVNVYDWQFLEGLLTIM